MKRLSGRVALVTGGGRGIGRAIAKALGREGARVAVNYRSDAVAAREVVEAIGAAGGHASAFQADVSRREEAERLVAEVGSRLGRLDVLVNNAGWTRVVPHDRLDLLTDDLVERTLAVNLLAPLHCIRAAVPLLRTASPGQIVNIASVAGPTGRGSSLAYCAAKAGLLSLSKGLARVLAPDIRVNSVLPGFVDTGFAYPPGGEMAERVARRNHIARAVTPEDIAGAVTYLLTDGSASTGGEIVVDGGLSHLWPRT